MGITVIVTVVALVATAAPASGAPAGSLDTTYGDNGVASVDFPGFGYVAGSVLQPDGKVIMAGTNENRITLVRLTTAGRLDPTFGGDGVVRLTRQYATAAAIRLASDGSIFVAGSTWRQTRRSSITEVNQAAGVLLDGGRMLVAKLTASGAPDPSFGTRGIAVAPPAGAELTSESAVDMVVTPSGSVVLLGLRGVVGTYYTGYPSAQILVQLTPAGAIDTSFGVNGVVLTAAPTALPAPAGLEVQRDGRLVVGYTLLDPLLIPFVPPSSELVVARFMPSGEPDVSYGIGGLARHDIGGSDWMRQISLDSSDRVVVFADSSDTLDRTVTRAPEAPPWRLFVLRLNSIGYRDLTFGDTGVALVEDPSVTLVWMGAGAIQPDGRILVAAAGWPPSYSENLAVRLQRLTADGYPDPSFATSTSPLHWVISLVVGGGRAIASGGLHQDNATFASAAHHA